MKEYWKAAWDGTWPLLVTGLVVFFVIVGFVTWARAPKCWACRHVSHKMQLCGTWMRDGNCICREDK